MIQNPAGNISGFIEALVSANATRLKASDNTHELLRAPTLVYSGVLSFALEEGHRKISSTADLNGRIKASYY